MWAGRQGERKGGKEEGKKEKREEGRKEHIIAFLHTLLRASSLCKGNRHPNSTKTYFRKFLSSICFVKSNVPARDGNI